MKDLVPEIVIQKIQQHHKITDYLSDRGISPKTITPRHSSYLCPLPGHENDSDPSFYVYDKGDHEDFICYGCKRGGSIINLVCNYEQIGFESAIKKLARTVGGLDLESITDSIILDCMRAMELTSDPDKEALELYFCLNKKLHDYIKAVEFNDEDVSLADTVGKHLEKLLYAGNIQALRSIDEEEGRSSLDGHIAARVNLFNSRKEEEEIARLKSSGGLDATII